MRFLKLSSTNRPLEGSVDSLARWMDAVKPLIQDESKFLAFPDDLVTVPREAEYSFLEETIEWLVRRSEVGTDVRSLRYLMSSSIN